MTASSRSRAPRSPSSYSAPGKLDGIQVSVGPVLLGGGVFAFFERFGDEMVVLEQERVIESENVTHLRYRVVRD